MPNSDSDNDTNRISKRILGFFDHPLGDRGNHLILGLVSRGSAVLFKQELGRSDSVAVWSNTYHPYFVRLDGSKGGMAWFRMWACSALL